MAQNPITKPGGISEEDLWKTIDLYFQSVKNYLTSPQLDSFNTFISTQIPKTARQFNPIELVSHGKIDYLGSDTDYQQSISVTIGGSITSEEGQVRIVNDGSGIWMGRPVIEERDSHGEIYSKQLFPNEARLKNLNYTSMLYANVQVELKKVITNEDGGTEVIPTDYYSESLSTELEHGGTSELGVSEQTHINTDSVIKTFHQVPLGRIPIMLHSKICSLYGQSKAALRAMGECPYGQGGYFIIKGKEKVIVAQERQMENKVFIHQEKAEDSPYSWLAEVRSSPEHVFQPARVTKVMMLRKKTLKSMNHQNQYLFDLYQKTNTFLGLGDQVSFSENTSAVIDSIKPDQIVLRLPTQELVTVDRDEVKSRSSLKVGRQVTYRQNVQNGIIEKRLTTDLLQVRLDTDSVVTKSASQLSLVKRKKDLDDSPRDPELWCRSSKKEKGKKKAQKQNSGLTIEEGTLQVIVPNIEKPVPLLILFRALGVESDHDILKYIVHDLDNSNLLSKKLVNILKPSIRESSCIQTQEIALRFLDGLARGTAISEAIMSPLSKRNRMSLMDTLCNYLLPHVGTDLTLKAHYLGYMINLTLSSVIGLEKPTCRDSYLAKRVDISGFLIAQLFRDLYFRLQKATIENINIKFSSLSKETDGQVLFENQINRSSIVQFINYRKIDDGMMYAFRNCWGMENAPCKEGIVQDLNIISAFGTFSNLRRINTPIPRSAKMRDPHSLHGSSWGIMCPTETPDGGNVGVRKNLAMQARITFDCSSLPLEEALQDFGVIDIRTLPVTSLDTRASVFLNGRLLGVHPYPQKLVHRLRIYRRNGLINIYTSVAWDMKRNEVKVSTESGRGCRPLLVVNNDRLAITQEWLSRASSDKCKLLITDKYGVTSQGEIPRKQWEKLKMDPQLIQEQIHLFNQGNTDVVSVVVDSRSPWEILLSGYHRYSPNRIITQVNPNITEPLSEAQHSTFDNEGLFTIRESYLEPYSPKYICSPLDVETLEKNAGVIEYIDVVEENSLYLAMSPADLKVQGVGSTATPSHCEIHPSMILGVLASIIPFVNSNQAPRNQFSGAQTKQAVGVFATNYLNRMDTKSQVLLYPQAPIVDTRIGKYLSTNSLPFGINAIVAIACFTGYNQDDSVIINQSALDRGLFRTVKFRTYTESEEVVSQGKRQTFGVPDPSRCINIPAGNFSKLQTEGIYAGIVREGERVNENDAIIGISIPTGERDNQGREILVDNSTFIRRNEAGIVDKVFVGSDIDGNKFCKVRIRKEKIPELGDKFASRHGQKGVIGVKISQGDMPCTDSGITPDIIINPQAFPKRMTVAQLVENILAKKSAIQGVFGDATGFVHISRTEIAKQLGELGFDQYGNELMYNGQTGEQLHVPIFIGPTYYQRLTHQVEDKIYSRADGSLSSLSHQPVGGRALGGGLRIGEMERDSLLGHGVASFLKESMMERSDKFGIWIDRCSGGLGIVNPKKNVFQSFSSYKTLSYVDSESNVPVKRQVEASLGGFSHLEVPYAFKLFMQEMMSMCIMPRLVSQSEIRQWQQPLDQKRQEIQEAEAVELEATDVYYSKETQDRETQQLLRPMTRFHNTVKSLLISGATQKLNQSLIDFSCGRGGDILKWMRCRLNEGNQWYNNYLGCPKTIKETTDLRKDPLIVGLDVSLSNIHMSKNRLRDIQRSDRYSKAEREWAKNANIHFFERDTSVNLYGTTDVFTKHRNERYFPKVPGVDRRKLQISPEGHYSITQPNFAWDIISIFSKYFPDLSKLTITDATGGIGGDTISFARRFKKVFVYEMNPEHCSMIRHNLKAYKLFRSDKVKLTCDDFTKHLSQVNSDLVYVDPPWGGPDKVKQAKVGELRLSMGQMDLADIVKSLRGKKTKLVALKIPPKFDRKHLQQTLRGWMVRTYDLGKMQLLLCIPPKSKLWKQGHISPDTKIQHESASSFMKKVGEHRFQIASSMFSIHYYFEQKDVLSELLENAMRSLCYNGFFLVTCLDGELVYKKLSSQNTISGEIQGQTVWKVSRGREWVDFGANLPNDDRSFGREIKVMVKSISDKEMTEYLVHPSVLINQAARFGLQLASQEVVSAKYKFLTSGTGTFWDIYQNMNPKPFHEDYAKDEYIQLQEYTKLHRYYIFQYREDATYPFQTFENADGCQNWKERNLVKTGFGNKEKYHHRNCNFNRKHDSVQTNPQFSSFHQYFFVAGNESQLSQYIREPRRLIGNNITGRGPTASKFSRNPYLIDSSELKPIIDTVQAKLNHPRYRDATNQSFENTLSYMFNHMRTGIYVKIKGGCLSMFIPFVKSDFTDQMGEKYIKLDPTIFPGGLAQYYALKRLYYPGKSEDFDEILPRNEWHSNNCMIGNVRAPNQWGDQFFGEIRNMFEALVAKRNIRDTEFFVNKRDFPYLRENLSEPYWSIYNSSNHPTEPRYSDPEVGYVPILGFTGVEGYLDLPIPTPDDWVLASKGVVPPYCKGPPKIDTISWSKRKDQAIFRGTSTGCGTTEKSNQRIRLCAISWKLSRGGLPTEGESYTVENSTSGNNLYPILNQTLTVADKGSRVLCKTQGVLVPGKLLLVDPDGDFIVKLEGHTEPTFFDEAEIFPPITAPFTGTVRQITSSGIVLQLPDSQEVQIPMGRRLDTPIDARFTSWNIRDRKNVNESMTFVKAKIEGLTSHKCSDANIQVPAEFCDAEGNLKFDFDFPASREFRKSYQQQAEYKYCFYVDGWAAAYRYSTMMLTGSTILKVESLYGFELWFFKSLKPLHLIDLFAMSPEKAREELKSRMKTKPDHIHIPKDFTQEQIVQVLSWCRQHDQECEQIGLNAKETYQRLLSEDRIFDYLEFLLGRISDNIIEQSNQTLPPISVPTNLAEPEEILIPEQKLGLVFGAKSFNLSKLQMETNTTIQKMEGQAEVTTTGGTQVSHRFMITGTLNNIREAKSKLLTYCDYHHTKRSVPVSLDCFHLELRSQPSKWYLSGEEDIMAVDGNEATPGMSALSYLKLRFSESGIYAFMKKLDGEGGEVRLTPTGGDEAEVQLHIKKGKNTATVVYTELINRIKDIQNTIQGQTGTVITQIPSNCQKYHMLGIWGNREGTERVELYLDELQNNLVNPTITVHSVLNPAFEVPTEIPVSQNLLLELQPDETISKNIAIIVPFRNGDPQSSDISKNRELQLTKFVRHLEEFFKEYKQSINYTIFVIEQEDSEFAIASSPSLIHSSLQGNICRKFNRGALINAGVSIVTSLPQFTNLIIHDVDLLPEDLPTLVSSYVNQPQQPNHLAGYNWTRYKQLSGTPYFGGALKVSPADFIATGGYPNHHWGWGKEDLVFKKRLVSQRAHIDTSIGHYTDLEDISTLVGKMQDLRKHKDNGQGICQQDLTLSASDFNQAENQCNAVSGLYQKDWYELAGSVHHTGFNCLDRVVRIPINLLSRCNPLYLDSKEMLQNASRDLTQEMSVDFGEPAKSDKERYDRVQNDINLTIVPQLLQDYLDEIGYTGISYTTDDDSGLLFLSSENANYAVQYASITLQTSLAREDFNRLVTTVKIAVRDIQSNLQVPLDVYQNWTTRLSRFLGGKILTQDYFKLDYSVITDYSDLQEGQGRIQVRYISSGTIPESIPEVSRPTIRQVWRADCELYTYQFQMVPPTNKTDTIRLTQQVQELQKVLPPSPGETTILQIPRSADLQVIASFDKYYLVYSPEQDKGLLCILGTDETVTVMSQATDNWSYVDDGKHILQWDGQFQLDIPGQVIKWKQTLNCDVEKSSFQIVSPPEPVHDQIPMSPEYGPVSPGFQIADTPPYRPTSPSDLLSSGETPPRSPEYPAVTPDSESS